MSRYRYLFMYSGGCFFELAKYTVLVLIIGVLIHVFIFTIIPIKGQSMEPNFLSGDWVILDKLSYLTGDPKRGEAVAVRFPGDPKHEKYIKRVIALPNETITIKDGRVFVNGKEIKESYLPDGRQTFVQISGYPTTDEVSRKLGNDEYYLIGDNRINSADSRVWGPVTTKEFIGKARFIIFPFSRYSYVFAPGYPL